MKTIEEVKYHFFMNKAIEEAYKAWKLKEVPIGAVVVYKDKVIGRGYNLREVKQQSREHAEMIAIHEACEYMGSWRLEDCELYVTLEPCPMCAGAILLSRVKKVIYGARDPKGGCCRSLYTLLEDSRFNHQCEIVEGIQEEECGQLLSNFFRQLRLEKKKRKVQNKTND